MTNEELVTKQLQYYNDKDVDSFIQLYHVEIKVYRDQKMEPDLIGISDFRKMYEDFFLLYPKAKAVIHRRSFHDKYIEEIETLENVEKFKEAQFIVQYYFSDGLISEVRFIQVK